MNFDEQINAMLDELSDNPAEAKAALERVRRENAIVRSLQQVRLDAGCSQRELAKASGMSPAKVCRMESGNDNALKIGDIRQYLSGIGMSMHVMFDDESKPAAIRIKQMVIEIGLLLAKLTDLAEEDQNDRTIIDGINRFRGEVLFNFVMRYANTQPRITVQPSQESAAPEAPAPRPRPSRTTRVPACSPA